MGSLYQVNQSTGLIQSTAFQVNLSDSNSSIVSDIELYIFTTNISGALSVSNYTFPIRRMVINGVTVIDLFLKPFSGTASSSSTIVAATAIPSRFYPTTNVIVSGSGVRNTTLSTNVQISTAGIITFYGDSNGGNYQASESAAYNGQSVSYSL